MKDTSANNLYYGYERLDSRNYDFWNNFEADQYKNTREKVGLIGFQNILRTWSKRSKDEYWICYATVREPNDYAQNVINQINLDNHEASLKDKIQANNYIEMIMGVMTDGNVIFTHMGISRCYQFNKGGTYYENRHGGMSIKHHSASANFTQFLYPSLKYMVTCPAPMMRSIMKKKFGNRLIPVLTVGGGNVRKKFYNFLQLRNNVIEKLLIPEKGFEEKIKKVISLKNLINRTSISKKLINKIAELPNDASDNNYCFDYMIYVLNKKQSICDSKLELKTELERHIFKADIIQYINNLIVLENIKYYNKNKLLEIDNRIKLIYNHDKLEVKSPTKRDHIDNILTFLTNISNKVPLFENNLSWDCKSPLSFDTSNKKIILNDPFFFQDDKEIVMPEYFINHENLDATWSAPNIITILDINALCNPDINYNPITGIKHFSISKTWDHDKIRELDKEKKHIEKKVLDQVLGSKREKKFSFEDIFKELEVNKTDCSNNNNHNEIEEKNDDENEAKVLETCASHRQAILKLLRDISFKYGNMDEIMCFKPIGHSYALLKNFRIRGHLMWETKNINKLESYTLALYKFKKFLDHISIQELMLKLVDSGMITNKC